MFLCSIKLRLCGHGFYCIYRDIIEYRDNSSDDNRDKDFIDIAQHYSPYKTSSATTDND